MVFMTLLASKRRLCLFQSYLAELRYLRFSILVEILTPEYFFMSSRPFLGSVPFPALLCAYP